MNYAQKTGILFQTAAPNRAISNRSAMVIGAAETRGLGVWRASRWKAPIRMPNEEDRPKRAAWPIRFSLGSMLLAFASLAICAALYNTSASRKFDLVSIYLTFGFALAATGTFTIRNSGSSPDRDRETAQPESKWLRSRIDWAGALGSLAFALVLLLDGFAAYGFTVFDMLLGPSGIESNRLTRVLHSSLGFWLSAIEVVAFFVIFVCAIRLIIHRRIVRGLWALFMLAYIAWSWRLMLRTEIEGYFASPPDGAMAMRAASTQHFELCHGTRRIASGKRACGITEVVAKDPADNAA